MRRTTSSFPTGAAGTRRCCLTRFGAAEAVYRVFAIAMDAADFVVGRERAALCGVLSRRN